jgi:hypothetical protein
VAGDVIAESGLIFVEMKLHRGLASKAKKQVRAELLAGGAEWWLARSARAVLMALHRWGEVFRRPWTLPRLEPWEEPFADPNERWSQEAEVTAQRRAAQQRWRLRASKPRARERDVGGYIAA